jgi:cytosine/adenosine deaminase-related metal-dependent hydrolase
LITGGRILDLEAAEGHVDADGAYLAPGFVDGHVHLSAVLGSAQPYAPATGASLFGGAGSTADIGRALHRFLSMPVPPEIVEAAVAPVLAALAAGGTTAVVDAGSAGIDGVVAAARRVGVRLAIGPAVHDVLLDDAGDVATHCRRPSN